MAGKVKVNKTEDGVKAMGGNFNEETNLDYKIFKLARFLMSGAVVIEGFPKTSLKSIASDGIDNVSMSNKALIDVEKYVPYFEQACKLLEANKTPFTGEKAMTIKLKVKI